MPKVSTLDQVHEDYVAQVPAWARYESFTGHMDSVERKKPWLPQGSQEDDEDYRVRLNLTHNLGFSRAAIKRMVGTLTKTPATRDYDPDSTDGGMSRVLKPEETAKLLEFDQDATRTGTDFDGYQKSVLRYALRDGVAFTMVDAPAENAGAESGGQQRPPFCEMWTAPEVINWSVDVYGHLEWVVMRRDVWIQDSPTTGKTKYRLWRVLTQTTGEGYRAAWVGDDFSQEPEPDSEAMLDPTIGVDGAWQHDVGMVPLVPLYAEYLETMVGESYIKDVSLADHRKLQFDSDQAMASYLDGSPLLAVWTNDDLDDIGAGAGKTLKLKPDTNEDARYLQPAVAGMQLRSGETESTMRQATNLAGIDPESVVQQGSGTQARSGVSLALSFSTAEAPTLGAISDEMERHDRAVHELVTRYASRERFGPQDQAFGGTVKLTRSWDLMSAERQADLALTAAPMVRSEAWMKATAKSLARQIPGNLGDEELQTIDQQIDETDYSPLGDPPGMGSGGPPQPGDEGALEGEDDESGRDTRDGTV